MKDDPTIAAMREARHKISAAVNHDPRKLVAHYRESQNGIANAWYHVQYQ